MPETEPPEVVDEDGLYAVAPEQFIVARDALVKRRRSEGDKSGAARVGRLRRPPLTVWVLNQVARTTPEVIEALLAAGQELRAAMERALDGDASGLRRARDAERASVGAVVSAAEGRLSAGGYAATEVMRQRVAATLRAAIVDESVAARLRGGTLDRDHDAPGFGMDALAAPLTLVRSPDHPESRPQQPAAEQPAEQPRLGTASGTHDDVDAAHHGQVAAPGRRPQAGQHEADRLEAGLEAAEAERLDGEAERLTGEAERLTGEAERLTGEAERLAAEAEQMAAESERLAAEAERLGVQAQQLAAEAQRRAAIANEAEDRAAVARGRAGDARRAAEVGRASADRPAPT